jgi:endoglucanase
MFSGIKKAGFSSVRIPVAWSNLMEAGNTIHPPLMDRVVEVVDMALAERLIVVLNIHWDSGWWTQFEKDEKGAMERYTRIWSQISKRFKDYPQALVLESLNEEACFNGIWDRYKNTGSKKKAYDLANRINQTFVDLVRNSGGGNSQRQLLIAGYCTDIDLTADPFFKMPADPAQRSIVSVHYYTPFGFTHLTKNEPWAKARRSWGTAEDKRELEANFNKLKAAFLDKGIPVILGEYGATIEKKELESVREYILEVANLSYKLGMCPMLWDIGVHYDRNKMAFNDPELPKGFQKILQSKR